MLIVEYTAQFKKDLKRVKRRNKNIKRLESVLKDIQQEQMLQSSFKDHTLKGNWIGYRECHLEPDWLLVYKIIETEKVVVLVRTGSHSDLFQ